MSWVVMVKLRGETGMQAGSVFGVSLCLFYRRHVTGI